MILIGIILSLVLICAGIISYIYAPRKGMNPSFGLRIGYSYISKNAWIKTNVFAAKIFSIEGILLMILSIFLDNTVQNILLFVVVLDISILIALYVSIRYSEKIAEIESLSKPVPEKNVIKPIEIDFPRKTHIFMMILLVMLFNSILIYSYPILPNIVAFHFSIKGNPDLYLEKNVAILYIIVGGNLEFIIYLFLGYISKIKPMILYTPYNFERKKRFMDKLSYIFILLYIFLNIMLVYWIIFNLYILRWG